MTALTLAEVEYERFANPPLRSMLGQIRFPLILRLDEPGFVAPFQDALRPEYPDVRSEQQVGLLVSAEGGFNTSASRQWRFSTADGTWSVVATTGFVTLEAAGPNYGGFEEFNSRFSRLWGAVLEHLRPTRVSQQGLRYINHIEHDVPASGWRSLINNELLGPIGAPVFGDELVQVICDLRLKRDDGEVAFKHGIVQAGPDLKRGYLLDFDYFIQDPGNDMAAEVLSARFSAFHDVIYRLFRWSVTAAAIEEFRGGETAL